MTRLGNVTVRLKDERGGLHPFVVYRSVYLNGALAITLFDHGRPFGKISVNVPEYNLPEPLGPDEFVVNHNLDDWWAGQLLDPPHGSDLEALANAQPLFEDTGRRVSYGHVTDRPIWRLCVIDDEGEEAE